MPFRKEVKEAVIYPPSKRKAPPFKPQRPSKISRTSTEISEEPETARGRDDSATVGRNNSLGDMQRPPAAATKNGPSVIRIASKSVDLISDSEHSQHDSSDDLPDDPLKSVALKKAATTVQPKSTTKASASIKRAAAVLEPDVEPPDIDQAATIPQRLLLRLLHENFNSQDTKVDKHAIAILQQYVDIFVRETVARAALNKKDDVDSGQASQSEANWLERENLEKVAGGMLMDF